MTIRGGGNPHTAMAAMPLGEWTRRLGALLAEAYDCFMVGTLHGSTEYKRGSRAIARGQWQAPPRIIAWQTTRSRAGCRRARVGQGQAFGGAEEAPSLTLAARDGDGQYAVGAEECSRRGSNKTINKQGRDKMVCTTLDKESPIQAVLAEAYDCFMVGTLHGSTEYKRGSRAIARGQWQAPLGSSRGKPPDHGQFAAVLALVEDKPSAALKKRRP